MFSLPITNPWYIIFKFNPAKSYLWYIYYLGTLILMENISGVKSNSTFFYYNIELLACLGIDLKDHGRYKMILLMPIFNLPQTGDPTSDTNSAVVYISSNFSADYQHYFTAGMKCWSCVAAMVLWLVAMPQHRSQASRFPPWRLWQRRLFVAELLQAEGLSVRCFWLLCSAREPPLLQGTSTGLTGLQKV